MPRTKASARRTTTARSASASTARWRTQREELLQAARRAIDRRGAQISMDDIAAEAGITKPIVYRHFGDRRGLALALRDSAFGVMLGTPTGDAARDRATARERVAAFYPVVSDPDHLRRVVVGFATGFQMFVAMNRNLYRFLRIEGVLDSMWDDSAEGSAEPVATSLAASLRAVFAGRIDGTTADIWANALRGMVREIVDWSSRSPQVDRFELERQFELLARALLDGLDRALPAGAPRVASQRSGTPRGKVATRPRRPRGGGQSR
jgi:AcrR family transcriptional regulator